MKSLILGFLMVLLASVANARAPQGHCRLSYHSDSAGRGIEAGFKGLNLRPDPVDENCYLQGVDEGSALPKNDSFCAREFENGKQSGLMVSNSSTGTECFNKGYIAGFALLGVAARASDSNTVGRNCVDQYRLGYSDGSQEKGPNNQPSSEPLSSCYLTGFYDSAKQ